jgi:CRP-like cAMP-binding protein
MHAEQTHPDQSLDLLAGSDLLRTLKWDEVNQIADACTEVRYQAGDTIFQQGREERALRFILEGRVEIDITPPRAGDRMLTQLGPGAVFGETSFFHAGPHSATARCMTDVRLLRLDRNRFDDLIRNRNSAALQLAANAADLLAARLQQTDGWIVALLEAEQDHKNHEAWSRFRQQLGQGFSGVSRATVGPGSMVGPAA